MSKRHIYFPSDLLKKGKSQKDGWYILGYRYECVYIVIQLVSEEYNTCNPPLGVLHGIEVIGTLNKQESKDQWLSLRLEDSKYPVLENYTRNDGGGITIIIFQPPNFKNLEYLSIKPILLQSGNEQNSVEPAVEIMNDKFKQIATPTINNDIHAFNTEILDKINQCYKLRTAYAKWTSKNGHSQFLKSDVLQMLRMLLYQFIFRPLTVIVCVLQTISIWLIKLLNIEYFKDNDGIGHKLTTYSAVLRQLELRLQQINYFPIQFLCYFDRTILYNESYPTGNFSNVGDTEFALVLNLPIFNSNLNINNSNYINFYNSVWLIINDVLVGITIQKLIVAHYNDIAKFINEVAIKKILFDDLYNLISWVSFRHPAGFKLNNELGLFVGDLFLWTLRFWKILCVDIFTISETGGLTLEAGTLEVVVLVKY